MEYDGSDYFGWQIQSEKKSHGTRHTTHVKSEKAKTVQGEVEKAIEKLFRQKVKLIYAGRTDRGVHAKDQVLNFFVDTTIPIANIKGALNSFLPGDIRVKRVKKVSDDFHARFSVSTKIYRYRILNVKEPSVFERTRSWWVPDPLDLKVMQSVAKKLIGYKDRSLFAKQPDLYHDCRRRIFAIHIKKKSPFVIIDIEADGFLRNMARNIVSFLVEGGGCRMSLARARDVLEGRFPWKKKPAPGYGLYLYKVKYSG